jgi:hypothetical protein
MPPIHPISHILRAGGGPAIAGAILAAVLSWPQKQVSLTAPSVLEPTKYHSTLGGSGLGLDSAVGAMIGWIIIFSLIGLAIGWILVATGVMTKDEVGIGE